MGTRKKKKGRMMMGVVVLTLIVVAGALFLLNGDSQAAATFTQEVAVSGSITSYYSFTGHVKVENNQNITATAPVTVRDVYVREGDFVAKNDRLLRTSDGTVIKAGVGGEVDKLHVAKDDDVQIGEQLIDIVDYEHMVIEIRVDEFDVPAVTVGTSAQVTVNALAQTFDSVVTRLERQATREGDISYYTAELALDKMEGVLPGMQVDVKICYAYAENAITISMDALQFDSANQPYVTTMQSNGGTREVPVRIGVNDGIRVEIVDGVRSGETVLLPAKVESIGMPFRNAARESMGGIGQ